MSAAAGRGRNDPKAEYKREITTSLVHIMDNTDSIPKLLACLLAADVIDEDEMERINSKPTKSEKLSAMTMLFLRKPRADWDRFKEALMDSRNEHVAEGIGAGKGGGD